MLSAVRSLSFGSRRFLSTAAPATPLGLKSVSHGDTDTDKLFKGKKVLVVGPVGAFTGVCNKQMPEYQALAAEFKKKGVDSIAMVTVNDPFVVDAWREHMKLDNTIEFYADFDASFTKSVGMDIDLSAPGLGVRPKRYAMLVEDGEVKMTKVEASPGDLNETSAENVLKAL